MRRDSPVGGERQESDAAEKVGQERALLQAHQTRRRGSTQPASARRCRQQNGAAEQVRDTSEGGGGSTDARTTVCVLQSKTRLPNYLLLAFGCEEIVRNSIVIRRHAPFLRFPTPPALLCIWCLNFVCRF